MVATANNSFIESPEFSRVILHTPFFWTMIALAALDIVLLFWLLNPVATSVSDLHKLRLGASQVRTTLGDAGSKRSPLGAVASRVTPKTSRSRNGFTTVAYTAR